MSMLKEKYVYSILYIVFMFKENLDNEEEITE